jgi:hypothetical protein
MPTIEQCREYALECRERANDRQISERRSSVLMNISRSWTALAHQLESLAGIIEKKGKLRLHARRAARLRENRRRNDLTGPLAAFG